MSAEASIYEKQPWDYPVCLSVDVTFHIPKHGLHIERYACVNANDLACWKANCTAYPQIGVEIVEEALLPERRWKAFQRLKRMRHKKAEAMNLKLRRAL